jgi:hypothetical protein
VHNWASKSLNWVGKSPCNAFNEHTHEASTHGQKLHSFIVLYILHRVAFGFALEPCREVREPH